jgi:hypothetical protein
MSQVQAAKKSKHLFKKADFESSQCSVVMRNVTTSTDLSKGQKPEIMEISEDTLSLLIPASACAEGHCLLLRFFDEQVYQRVRNSPRSVQDKAQRLAVTAKVIRIEPGQGEKVLATLELQQYVEKEWKDFLSTFSEIQKKVSTIIKRIKQ